MSSQLAIGAVSAVLRNLLDNGLVAAGTAVGAINVTAVAPDLVKVEEPDFGPRLNLFLYRVSPNQGWRNQLLPSYDVNGTRTSNPPLALDLHFLLTAYGKSDFQAEILLGYAMSLLHEHPVLDRAAIRRALTPSPLGPSILPPAFQALSASDLADQLEAVTLTFEPMDSEEMSRLWSAIQAHYRPTAGYVASVVLIETSKPTHSALPVLSRGPVTDGREEGVFVQPDLLPPLPTLFEVTPDTGQPVARLGDTLRVDGVHLDGTSAQLSFGHELLDAPNLVGVGTSSDDHRIEVPLPTGNAADQAWPAGVWTVEASLVRAGDTVPRTTNVAAFVLAPQAVLTPAPAITRDPGTGRVTVEMAMHPRVRPSQKATLALGSQVAVAEPHPTTTDTLTFEFDVVPDGAQWVRLTVDGAESVLLDRSSTPPSFDPAQKVTVPA
jgi:hypothetical protein